MRNLAIALVVLVTALTFYSALAFKSESIEADVAARVGAALADEDAEDIAVEVDGRHVTLSGVVYDEAAEARYLAVADQTNGALGPIDGLTLMADGGYINAVKSAAGITLSGTVPNEEARAALLAEAGTATDGEVLDQLVVSGPVAGWQDEATFGVSQLAGLTAGTLTASSGSFALSGRTDGDASGIEAAVADREGWSVEVSNAVDVTGFESEIARLTSVVTDKDAELSDVTARLAEREAEVSAARDTLAAQESDLNTALATLCLLYTSDAADE